MCFNPKKPEKMKTKLITSVLTGSLLFGIGLGMAISPHNEKFRENFKDHIDKISKSSFAQFYEETSFAHSRKDLEEMIYDSSLNDFPLEDYTEKFLNRDINQKEELKEKNFNSIIDDSYISYIIEIESNWNPKAESHVGARGLMQIMPATWEQETKKIYGKSLDFEKAFDPKINVEVGRFYLEETLQNYLSQRISNWENLSVLEKQNFIAAAYNGGKSRFIRNGGLIGEMPKETINYIQKLDQLRDVSPNLEMLYNIIERETP